MSYRYFPAPSGAPKAVRCTGAGETFLLLRFGVPLGRGGLVAWRRENGYRSRVPVLTSFFFPYRLQRPRRVCESPHGRNGPERPPRGGRSGKWASRVFWVGLEELERSRKCCSVPRRFSSSLKGPGLSEWGGGNVERRDLERRCGGSYKFSVGSDSGLAWSRWPSPVCKGNWAALPLPPLSVSNCPRFQGWRCHLRWCRDTGLILHRRARRERLSAHFMSLYGNYAVRGEGSFFFFSSFYPYLFFFF